MNRLTVVLIVFLSMSFLHAPSISAELVEGRDYQVLKNPQPTKNEDRIEVLEFFWYGCPHCNNLHPYIKNWLKNKPDDVDFQYVPAIFRDNWAPGAKMFYTISAMDGLDTLHDRIYDAIHQKKVDLSNEDIILDWIGRQEVDKEKFVELYHSFTTHSQVAHANQMMQKFQISGVPAFVVEGRYLVRGKKGGGPQDTIRLLEAVIEMVRKNKS